MADSESFVFYNSFLCILDVLPDDQQLALYQAISHYGAFHEMPGTTDPLVLGMFGTIKPLLDKTAERYRAAREAAKKGGAPKGNQNAKKQEQATVDSEKQPVDSEKQPQVDLENNHRLIDEQPYVYVYADDNVYADVDANANGDADVNDIPPYSPPRGSSPSLQEKRFDEFWKAYPKKQGKGAALKSWLKIRPNEELFCTILESVKENVERNPQWKKDHGQFIPNPATWLNQTRWEDGKPWEDQTIPDTPEDINKDQRSQLKWLLNSIAEDEKNASAGG